MTSGMSSVIPDRPLLDALRPALALVELFAATAREAIDGWPMDDAALDRLDVARVDAHYALEALNGAIGRTQRERDATE